MVTLGYSASLVIKTPASAVALTLDSFSVAGDIVIKLQVAQARCRLLDYPIIHANLRVPRIGRFSSLKLQYSCLTFFPINTM